ncbi:hypothetical protein [Paracoccus mutanolyticus]|uniref:hypothetical protein n=1 Tax=Paracoccus mutanolyticus TaxID=1499308 RepID=UPI0016742252|nr:hypothetical protein [Paracoccus mutanolyticus]
MTGLELTLIIMPTAGLIIGGFLVWYRGTANPIRPCSPDDGRRCYCVSSSASPP